LGTIFYLRHFPFSVTFFMRHRGTWNVNRRDCAALTNSKRQLPRHVDCATQTAVAAKKTVFAEKGKNG
jgi:hypothetical protein